MNFYHLNISAKKNFVVALEVEMLTQERVSECNTVSFCCWAESGIHLASVTILFSGNQIVIIQSEGERACTGHEGQKWQEALASPKAKLFNLFRWIHRDDKKKKIKAKSCVQHGTAAQKQNFKHQHGLAFNSCTLFHLSCLPSACPLPLCNPLRSPSCTCPPLSCSRSWGLREAAVCWHSWDVAGSLIPTTWEMRLSCSPSCSCNFDQVLMWLGSDPDMTGLATWKRS